MDILKSIDNQPKGLILKWAKDHIGLIIAVVIGSLLRLTNLTSKPPWTDEFATLVFSLGNNYQNVLLNQPITLDQLLQPLKSNLNASLTDVISLLIQEDNHPPLYFILSHLWLNLFPTTDGYVSLYGARSLAVFFGILSIILIYIVAKLAFHSKILANIAAALMAISPYGVFIAQEARHYTLAIIFVLASLGCLLLAAQKIDQRQTIPLWLVLMWIVINNCGFSTHYFFSLTLMAQAIALIIGLWYGNQGLSISSLAIIRGVNDYAGLKGKGKRVNTDRRQQYGMLYLKSNLKNYWRLSLVIMGTITLIFVWVMFIVPKDYGNGMTTWIYHQDSSFLTMISPLFQAIATWLTMIALLPVESSNLGIVIISGAVMIGFFLWLIPILYQGIKIKWQKKDILTIIVTSFVLSAIALFFLITYGFGIDITRGARYSFVYFPGVILLIAVSLHAIRQQKKALIIIWLMGLFSAVTVISNLGYQKYYRPDLLVSVIEANSNHPILIATTQKTLVETGEMMGIGWELKSHHLKSQINFLLAHIDGKQTAIATQTLKKTVAKLAKPTDLWVVNFFAPIDIDGCQVNNNPLPSINGYEYVLYRCDEAIERVRS